MEKNADIIDVIKTQINRVNDLESSQIDANLLNFTTAIGSVGVSGISVGFYRGIGSDFYFNVPGHNILNSPSSLLGKNYAGSTLI